VNKLNQLLSERDHGQTTFSGLVDEPATVTVNGKPAKVMSTNGGTPLRFEAPVDLAVGANTVVVEARDGNNNVATKTYSVPTTGTSKTYEHDANGNLRYEKQPNGAVIREYRWDQQNRLVRMLAGTHESVYDYDGQSRRVRITEKENSVQTKQETFIWCGSRICQKRSGSTVVRSYFGQGFEQGSDDYFYTRDHLGSVREVVGSDGTTVGSRLSYDPWGKVTETGSVLGDFTYTGHYSDRPTGLSLAWYRGYDSNLARWLSKDPIGLEGGSNLYGYANNAPLTFIDPDGRAVIVLAAICAAGACEAAAAAAVWTAATVAAVWGSLAVGDWLKSQSDADRSLCDHLWYSKSSEDAQIKHLAELLNIPERDLSAELHRIKKSTGLRGRAVPIDVDGTVRDPVSGEEIGNVLDK
jgi:RHS repeat-associated protein